MDDFDVILSLTTWSKRLSGDNVRNTLTSLIEQTCSIKTKIVLSVFQDDIRFISDSLMRFIRKNNIEILECPVDLMSHKKYFYVMQKYRYKPIILFDDDLIYNKNTVQLLYDNYKKNPGCVSARRCREISYDKIGIAHHYNTWRLFNKYGYKPSYDLLATTGGGTLFPSDILKISSNDISMIGKFKTADDIFLKYRMDQLGIPVSYVYDPDNSSSYREQEESSDNSSLCFVNTQNEKMNNVYIKLSNIRDRKKNPERIIVSMTSWKGRIDNVYSVINRIYNNTILPDVIALNLSEEEFTNKEKDLPEDIIMLKDTHKSFEINWVGKNTKPYKKIIPTLLKYPNDVIITIDDDIEYPYDFIENMYYEFLRHGKTSPITGGTNKWWNKFYSHLGGAALVKNEMFGPFLMDMYENLYLKNPETFKFSDPIITYAALINGRRYAFTNNMNMSRIRRRTHSRKNSLSNIGTDEYMSYMKNEHMLIQKYIHDKYHIYIENLL